MSQKVLDGVDNAQEMIEGVFTPVSTKGYQEDMDKYEYYDNKKFVIEEARRNDTSPDKVNFVFALVFQDREIIPTGKCKKFMACGKELKYTTKTELDNQRLEICEKIEAAGFVTQSIFTAARDKIIVKIGCNDARLLAEAELRDHMLELNPLSLQHVLEKKVIDANPDADVDKPVRPIYLGYEDYTNEDFNKILNLGGEGVLPIFRTRDFFTNEVTKTPITIADAQSTFKSQCSANPFKHIHFKYDSDWEKKIITDHKVQLYRTYRDKTILRTVDRIELVQVALLRDTSARRGVRGAGLDLKGLKYKGKIVAFYPLEYSNQIMLAQDLGAKDIYNKFKVKTCCGLRMFLPFKQPVQDIRDFCGEKVAYYFAFLEFYSLWLIFSAFLGLIVFVLQLLRLQEQTGGMNLLDPVLIINRNNSDFNVTEAASDAQIATFVQSIEFTTPRTPFTRNAAQDQFLFMITPTEIPFVILIFSVLIALWGGFFIEFWKRREATLAFKWGVSDFEATAEVRPEFKSKYDVPDAVTGLPTPYRSRFGFLSRLVFSFTAVGTLVGITVAAISATYVFKVIMSQNSALNPLISTQVALISNAVAIIILSMFFKSLGRQLTDYENHRTDIEYEDQLILKIFIFSFFNSYTTLIYFAFIKSGTSLLGDTQFCSANLEDFLSPEKGGYLAEDLVTVDSCYGALGYSLIIIFVLQIFINNFQEIGMPIFWNFLKSASNVSALKKMGEIGGDVINAVKGEEKADDPQALLNKLPLKSPAEKQYLLEAYTTPFYDYLELALQFGYVTLFVAGFPLAPLLALLNNFVEVWVDAEKVFSQCRRPNVQRAQDIGTWLKVFEVLSYIAIVTNAGVLVFTSVEIIPLNPAAPEDEVWAFLVFILGVFTIKYVVDLGVPDVPEDVTTMLARQKFYEQKIFFDTEDDTENILIKEDKEKKLNEAEENEKLMVLMERYEPLQVDPYVTEIIEEVRGNLLKTGLTQDKLFALIDTDKTGKITLSELKATLQNPSLGIGKEVDLEVIKHFVNALDLNGDGKITKEELAAFVAKSVADEV